MTADDLDLPIPGIAELLRAKGAAAGAPGAALSRGLAGVAGRTLIVNLAGSDGAVRDGLVVLGEVLAHALEQLVGREHPATRSSSVRPARHGVPDGAQ